MSDTKILFNKTSSLENFDQELMDCAEAAAAAAAATASSSSESPPTYEESAKSGFIAAAAQSSSSSLATKSSLAAKASSGSGSESGSVSISLEKLSSSPAAAAAATSSVVGVSGGIVSNYHHNSPAGSSVSVDQMVEELTALQRAQMHLYKRLQHVKSQTYAALALVLLMAGLIVIFLATYQPSSGDKIASTAAASTDFGHRSGKALVSDIGDGQSISRSSTNTIDDDTAMLLKHLSKLTSSSSSSAAAPLIRAHTDRTPVMVETPEDTLHVESIRAKEIAHAADAMRPSSKATTITTSVTTTTTTIPTTTTAKSTTTTTTEMDSTDSHEEFGDETEKPPSPSPPSQPRQPTPILDTYNISIVIHSATVPNMDYLPLGRASDTYCDVFIDDVLIGSTPIIDNSNNPNWQYLLPKAYRVRHDSRIRVDLLDRDHLKKDHIGGVMMLVRDLVATESVNRPVKFFHGRGDVWVTVKLV